MTDVILHDLDARWDESIGDPVTLFEQDDPSALVGSYVIQPGERVPQDGWTSHDGAEFSVILSGELRLITHATDTIVSENTISVIPGGVEHYSVNESDKPVRLVYTVVGQL